MTPWDLPTSLNLSGVDWQIRSDYRAIIDILIAFDNPQYELDEKWVIALTIFYVDFDDMPQELYQEAQQQLSEFIGMGVNEEETQPVKVMDWEQDANLIIPAVNRVIGHEVRSVEYMHWWTFFAAYMEIGGDCAFSNILKLRLKRAKGKKLEKWERDYIAENKKTVILQKKKTEEEILAEKEEEKQLEELFG